MQETTNSSNYHRRVLTREGGLKLWELRRWKADLVISFSPQPGDHQRRRGGGQEAEF